MRQLILRSEQTNKDSTKIAGLFTSILKEKQENADIAMLAAQYLLTKKMDKEATPVLHQVLEIDPENTPARLQLLSFAIREQEYGSSNQIVCSCFRIYSGCIGILLLYGIGLSSERETDEALEVFKKE